MKEEVAIDRTRFPVEEWSLRETRYDSADLGATETLFAVANGYVGLRGNVDEGRDSFAHGTFINGFHETWQIHHSENAYGFAKVGQTIINVPDVKTIRLYVDDEPLLLSVADLEYYDRELSFTDGMLTRSLIWRTPSGKRVEVKSTRMVSFTERHLVVLTFEVTVLDDDAPVVISSQVLNRQDGQDEYYVRGAAMGEGFDPRKSEQLTERVLIPALHHAEGGRSMLGYRVADSGMTISVGVDHTIDTENEYQEYESTTQDRAKHTYRIAAKAGVPIRISKIATYHTSRGVPPRELVDRCERTLDRAADAGVPALWKDQRDWLDAFWDRSDVKIKGDPAVQQAVRWNLFQLAQATARAEGNGIPAKGLTGSGYSGHYFWDTEIYVLPFLTFTSPNFARNALRFRYEMLDHARRRARELNQDGALFPWRTINGEEASAYYAAGTAQYHIDADISYALNQYVAVTNDDMFLAREGIDILVETARLWADLGFWRGNTDPRFHIHGVTGPDEYTAVVNDNLYTNIMAQENLRAAVNAVKYLQDNFPGEYERMVLRLSLTDAEVEEWSRAAEGMYIPYDEELGIHPQDDQFLEKELWDFESEDPTKRPLLLHYHPLVIYRFQVLKQTDVVLALFLLSDQFTESEKRADFDYYDALTTGDSTLSAVVQSIIAAEVGYEDLAMEYFRTALYVDLGDLHSNTLDGVHVASMGGVWQALVCGFGGMRDREGMLSFDPRLPKQWEELAFPLTIRGSRLNIRVTHSAIELRVEGGNPLSVDVRGERMLVGSETVRVNLS